MSTINSSPLSPSPSGDDQILSGQENEEIRPFQSIISSPPHAAPSPAQSLAGRATSPSPAQSSASTPTTPEESVHLWKPTGKRKADDVVGLPRPKIECFSVSGSSSSDSELPPTPPYIASPQHYDHKNMKNPSVTDVIDDLMLIATAEDPAGEALSTAFSYAVKHDQTETIRTLLLDCSDLFDRVVKKDLETSEASVESFLLSIEDRNSNPSGINSEEFSVIKNLLFVSKTTDSKSIAKLIITKLLDMNEYVKLGSLLEEFNTDDNRSVLEFITPYFGEENLKYCEQKYNGRKMLREKRGEFLKGIEAEEVYYRSFESPPVSEKTPTTSSSANRRELVTVCRALSDENTCVRELFPEQPPEQTSI